jgi:hypothetical protein
LTETRVDNVVNSLKIETKFGKFRMNDYVNISG